MVAVSQLEILYLRSMVVVDRVVGVSQDSMASLVVRLDYAYIDWATAAVAAVDY